MKISCLFVRPRLEAFVDDELSARAAEHVREHAAHCDLCKRELRGLYSLRRAVQSMRVPSHGDPFWEELWRGVLARSEGDEPRELRFPVGPNGVRRTLFAGALLAAALLVAAGGYLVSGSLRQPQASAYVPYIDYHLTTIDQHLPMESHFWNAQYVSVSYNGQ